MGAVVSVNEAKDIRRNWRTQGKVVVFTNGVFDLLHVGHVRYLEAASRLGDALVLGLNSDRSTRQLKGEGRPLTPQAERAEILCALACVDLVIIFDETTAECLVETLKPDVYVKGGDYEGLRSATSSVLPEAKVVERHGGRVEILPFTEGLSTTRLIERVLQVQHAIEDPTGEIA